MLSTYKIKPKFQQLLKPVLVALFKMGISANAITWTAIILSAVTGVLFWLHPSGFMLLVLPIVLLVRMALNALDGMMARTYNMQSKQGEVLNEFGDVVSDLFLFLPFLKLIPPENSFAILLFLFLAVINEFAGLLGKAVSGDRRYDGPMGKSDRALLIGLSCIILYCWPGFLIYLDRIFLVASFLLIISTGSRIYHTLKTPGQ